MKTEGSRRAFSCSLAGITPAIVVAAITTFLTAISVRGLPLLGGDAVCFSPAAISWAEDGQLVNTVYEKAGRYDRESRFVYYPPLYPIVLGCIVAAVGEKVPPQTAVAVLCAAVMAFHLAAARASLMWGDRRLRFREMPWLTCGFLVAMAASVFAIYLSVWGRPECVTLLSVAVFVFLVFSWPRSWAQSHQAIAVGLIAGVAAASQLILGAKMFLLGVMLLLGQQREKRLSDVASAAAVAATAFLGILLLFAPCSMMELFQGIREHSKAVLYSAPELWGYLWCGSNLNLPGWYLVYIIGLVAVVLQLRPQTTRVSVIQFIWASAAIAFAAIEYRFTILQPPATYNSASLVPVALIAIATWAMDYLAGASLRFVMVIATLLASMIGVGSCRVMYLAAHGAIRGPSLQQAREFLSPYVFGKTVGITTGIWPLFRSNDTVAAVEGKDFASQGDLPYDVLVVQQFNHSNITQVKGFEQIAEFQLGDAVTFLKTGKLSNSPMAYQLRIFLRAPSGRKYNELHEPSFR